MQSCAGNTCSRRNQVGRSHLWVHFLYCHIKLQHNHIYRSVSDFNITPLPLTQICLLCSAAMLFVVYTLCMYALYSFMPVVVKMTSATAVNLSLLTADLFSLFCGLFLFMYKVSLWCLYVCMSVLNERNERKLCLVSQQQEMQMIYLVS